MAEFGINTYNGSVIVPLADVHHILKCNTEHTKGIQVIMHSTRYDLEGDNWENPVWVGRDEEATIEAIASWNCRVKADGRT